MSLVVRAGGGDDVVCLVLDVGGEAGLLLLSRSGEAAVMDEGPVATPQSKSRRRSDRN